METDKIFQENNLQVLKDCKKVLKGRELEYSKDYQLMLKQLKRGEELAAYFIFQAKEDDLAIAINNQEQFETVVAVIEKDEDTIRKYIDNPNCREDIVFREVSFFSIP